MLDRMNMKINNDLLNKVTTSQDGIMSKEDKTKLNSLTLNQYLQNNEVEIGTWIDGKTIYRKVLNVEITSVAGAEIATFDFIDTLVNINGLINYGDGWHSIGYANGNYYSLMQYNNTTKELKIFGTSNYINKTLRLIIEYTKILQQ